MCAALGGGVPHSINDDVSRRTCFPETLADWQSARPSAQKAFMEAFGFAFSGEK